MTDKQLQVLDSSAFIYSYEPSEEHASINDVRSELHGSARYRFDAMQAKDMKTFSPTKQSQKEVREKARETGDHEKLSETDIKVLAATHEVNGVLVTDDYAMQNVASAMGIDTEKLAQEGITDQWEWRYICRACGRTYDTKKKCPVCGTMVERTKKN